MSNESENNFKTVNSIKNTQQDCEIKAMRQQNFCATFYSQKKLFFLQNDLYMLRVCCEDIQFGIIESVAFIGICVLIARFFFI